MSDAAIKAALEAAVREMAAADDRCPYDAEACRSMPLGPDWHQSAPAKMAAAAVAAFLRALPDRFPMPGAHNPDCMVWGHAHGEMHKLAAAVARAARGEDA